MQLNTITSPEPFPKILLGILGPTASGKTAVAFEFSKLIPCDIISCDSMQVYRGMPVITQGPTPQEIKEFHIHLASFLKVSQEFSAADFRDEAKALIPRILKNGRVPLLVGGTGLYFRALADGLFEAENSDLSKDESLREKLMAQHVKLGPGALHDKLKKIDTASAEKIHPNDVRRIIRSLEVFELTGKPMSAQKTNRWGLRSEYNFRIFLLERDRSDLYRRIDARVDRMIGDGAVSEVESLHKQRLSKTASAALGIKELKDALENTTSLELAISRLKQNSRNYAKRQLSWFRHERDLERVAVAPDEPAKVTAERILDLLKK